jgi:recombination protein RecT
MSQIGNAIEKRDQGPAAVVEQYRESLALVMPSHLQQRVGAWIRNTQGLLRRDEKLMEAAQNDVGQFIAVLMDAGRLGLEPGTEQYHLVPRWNKKKRCTEVTGVRGYQGEIELMYRAGAVSSVIVEPVFANDGFDYQPGVNDRPIHTVDWFADDRGALVLAYAYAVMKDGAVSKVVVVNKARIKRAKEASSTAGKSFSPWTSDEVAMWMKTAAHDLAKWVPTSAEYIREQLRAVRDVATEPAPAPVEREPIDVTAATEIVYDDEGDSTFPADGAS